MSEAISNNTLAEQLETIRTALHKLDAGQAVKFFQLEEHDRLWKSTISLCPQCLRHIPALVFGLRKKVYLRKVCSEHGYTTALIESDESFYHLSNKDQWGRKYVASQELAFPLFKGQTGGCGSSCGIKTNSENRDYTDQVENKSCTILVEVTNACNLACAVCYSDAKGNRKLPLADFKTYLQRLIDQKGHLDSVQLTGGEAVLHPEFWDMVAFLHDSPGVKKIYLPTNGIEFAKPEVAARLTPYAQKVMVLLQFDGAGTASNQALRNANTVRLREATMTNLEQLKIHMQLTMTITLGVNDQEIGWVIATGMKHEHIKVIALQPVTYSGRYDLAQEAMQRLTLSDVVKGVAAQIQGYASERDFSPIPCSHPNCGWITLFARRFGMKVNISRHIDLNKAMNQVANRTLLSTGELRAVIGSEQAPTLKRAGEWIGKRLVRSTDIFAIAIKPFMDKYNYDQDRISACCHHLLDTAGRPISFCEYNARLRAGDSWSHFPELNRKAP